MPWGIGGAERRQVQSGVTAECRAHLAGDRRFADGCEHLQVTGLEHDALIGTARGHGCFAADGSVRMLGIGGDQEAQALEQRRRRVYVRHPVGEMIQKDGVPPRQLDGGRHVRQAVR